MPRADAVRARGCGEEAREASDEARQRVEEELVDDGAGRDEARGGVRDVRAPRGSIAGGPHPDPVVETGTRPRFDRR